MENGTIRDVPTFEGEVSQDYYNLGLLGNKQIHRLAKNGYTNNSKTFIKRCGFSAIFRSDNQLYSFRLSTRRVVVVEEIPTDSTKSAYYIFDIYDPIPLKDKTILNDIPFSAWESFSEFSYGEKHRFTFSLQSGIYSIINNEIINNLKDSGVDNNVIVTESGNMSDNSSSFLKGTNFSADQLVLSSITLRNDSDNFFSYYGVYSSYLDYLTYNKSNININNIGIIPAFTNDIFKQASKFLDGIIASLKNKYQDLDTVGKFKNLLCDINIDLSKDFISMNINVNGFMIDKKIPSEVLKIKDYSKSVFFNNRLLIFTDDKIYYSSIDNVYKFVKDNKTNDNIINNSDAGVVNFNSFYNFKDLITNVLSVGENVIITTNSTTFILYIDDKSPIGMGIKLVSSEGAIENGLLLIGSEIFKLSEFGIKKLVNYLYYSQIQEVDATLFQAHIYAKPHISLAYYKYRNEKYLFSLREDGVVFIHSLIPSGISSEIAYYINSSRYYMEFSIVIKQISTDFSSGVAVVPTSRSTSTYVVFSHKMFDCLNDNVRSFSFYDLYDRYNYNYLDLGVMHHSLVTTNAEQDRFIPYDYDKTTKVLTVYNGVLNNYIFNDKYIDEIKIGDKIRFMLDTDLPIIEIPADKSYFKLQLPLDDKNKVYKPLVIEEIIEKRRAIRVRGLVLTKIPNVFIDKLKTIFKEGEFLTDNLKIITDMGGRLIKRRFDLYGTKKPDDIDDSIYKPHALNGCYFAIGIPYRAELFLHHRPLDVGVAKACGSFYTLNTEEFYYEIISNEYTGEKSQKIITTYHNFITKVPVLGDGNNLQDGYDTLFKCEVGKLFALMGFNFSLQS